MSNTGPGDGYPSNPQNPQYPPSGSQFPPGGQAPPSGQDPYPGQGYQPPQYPDQGYQAYGGPPSRSGFPKWLIAVLALGALVVIGIGVLIFAGARATSDASKVSDEFIRHLQANDASGAYKLTANEFRKATSEQQLGNTFDQVQPFTEGTAERTGRTVKTGTTQGTITIFVYRIDRSAGGVYYVRVTAKRQSGDWKILSFRGSPTPLSSDSAE